MLCQKMNIERHSDILKAARDQIEILNPHTKKRLEKLIIVINKKREQKEVTRRLKIQNKKLLEQVVLLKKRIKKNSMEKAKITKRLSYLKKISNSLSVALGTCPHCGEKILPAISVHRGRPNL
jgi:prolyl-tRNA synthetase